MAWVVFHVGKALFCVYFNVLDTAGCPATIFPLGSLSLPLPCSLSLSFSLPPLPLTRLLFCETVDPEKHIWICFQGFEPNSIFVGNISRRQRQETRRMRRLLENEELQGEITCVYWPYGGQQEMNHNRGIPFGSLEQKQFQEAHQAKSRCPCGCVGRGKLYPAKSKGRSVLAL